MRGQKFISENTLIDLKSVMYVYVHRLDYSNITFTINYDIFTVNQCISPERIAYSVRVPYHVLCIVASW